MLSGRLGWNTSESGDILINGRKQTLAYGSSVSNIEESITVCENSTSSVLSAGDLQNKMCK